MRDYQEELIGIIRKEPFIMNILKTVKMFRLPEWYVAAGAIRNTVWDVLHGYRHRTRLDGIDVVYYDPAVSEERDSYLQSELGQILPLKWEVVNQAVVGSRDPKPKSCIESMSRWPETATSVGVRLEKDNSLTVAAPHGLEDLMNLVVCPSPDANRLDFRKRLQEKQWRIIWPKLEVIERPSSPSLEE